MTDATLTELNRRIAAIRENIRDLVEQAAAYSGAADDQRTAERIADQEAQLAKLLKKREHWWVIPADPKMHGYPGASASVGALTSLVRSNDRRRFPPPWKVETIPGGFKVCDANGQSLAYVYSRENPNDAHMAKVLTQDEARRIASNIDKLPTLLAKNG